MFAKVIPGAYDFYGRKIFRPSKKRHRIFHPTFPMGLFIKSELTKKCSSIRQISQFLRNCKYVSDEEQFGKKDYWMPPDEFEQKKKGDCEDYALWTWRQLMELGFSCRFVVGYSGKYGDGHAWITAEKDDEKFIVEPLASVMGHRMPRLSNIRLKPEISVEWDGKKLHYFQHEEIKWKPSLLELTTLVIEYLLFYGKVLIKILVLILLLPFFLARKAVLKIIK